TKRSSNLELFRILTMILIIAHHYVVNSGLQDVMYIDPLSSKSIFLFLFGAWGKTGINCFILITGYFMCKSNITMKKFIKLLAEVMFYRFMIYAIFLITGVQGFTAKEFVQQFIPFNTLSGNFTGTFLTFFLCIPFLNILIKNMTEKQHVYLIVLSCFIYVFFGTVPYFSVSMNYVSWFIVLYFISSYIRLYPKKIFTSAKIWGISSVFFIVVSSISVVACLWLSVKLDKTYAYYFVTDSNTFLALATGISTFMFFKNINLRYNKLINMLGGSTFGVLLIHANSDKMREWLWQDTLNNVGAYDLSWTAIHAIGSVLCIFIICSVIDILRIKLIETPLLKKCENNFNKIIVWYKKKENQVFDKLKINS
ncbi:MAG: acyltransferase, partial [Clostridia bacterium]